MKRILSRRGCVPSALATFLLSISSVLLLQAGEKPNVLFIVCDDLNTYVAGFGGHEQTRTPAIERLVKSGQSFTQAHCTVPICAPSRSSFLTGLYPHTSRNYGFDRWDQNDVLSNSRTIMDHFRANGYHTLGTGKMMHQEVVKEWSEWGNDVDYGPFAFDGNENVAHPDVPAPLRNDFGAIDGSLGPLVNLDGRAFKDGRPYSWRTGNWRKMRPFRYKSDEDRDPTADELNGTWAVEKLRSLARGPRDQPFFMGVGFIRPHTPLIVPQRYFDLFPLNSVKLPLIKPGDVDDTFLGGVGDFQQGDLDRGAKIFHSLVASYGSPEAALQRFIQAYLASVASVDDQIGRILDVIDNSPLKDNTLIIVTSDHGWQMGQKDYVYKNSLWDESTRVPLIIRVPGLTKAGSATSHPVSHVDLYPTLVDLCGLKGDTRKNGKGRPLDGHSLRPFLVDPKTEKWTGPDAALTALFRWAKTYDPIQQSYSLRGKDWRYIRYSNGREELYDHVNDPHEWTNLVLKPEQAARLESFRRQLAARLPEPENNPDADKTVAVDLVAAASSHREVQSLDGTWEIVFDPANQGRSAGWNLDANFTQLNARRKIAVPSAWELIEQDYEGVAYYRHEFAVPENWSGKVVRLQFGAVNYLAEIWLNGNAVGYHEGGFTPFEFRVDQVLQPGKTNVLIVRVVGPIMLSDKVVDGVQPMETPQWRGGLTGGIWQSVKLVATGDVRVQDVFLQPNLADRTATFQVELDHTAVTGKAVDVVIEVVEAKNPSAKIASLRQQLELRPGVSRHAWTVAMPNAKPWSPDAPFLYQAHLRILAAGQESDRWTHRFGLREFTIRNQRFVLNGQPIYLKAAFFEALYPNGIATPDSEAMARREIQLAKEAGFNMIRPWRRPPVPWWLDLADEMGVLVVGSPALECMGMPLATPYLPARVKNEISQAVLRDRNRTCVVKWELFNEETRPILAQMMRPMAMHTRDLDPTRLILDESGGWAAGANMYLPRESTPTKFNDIHSYPGPFINAHLFDGFLAIGLTDAEKVERGFKGRAPGRNVVPGLMSFVSELGYGSLPNLPDNNHRFRQQGNPLTPAFRYHHRLEQDQMRVLRESGFAALYPHLEAFCRDQQAIHGAANKRMVEAVRSNPKVEGYCIHALTDGDWILGAGLLDLWRNPKSDVYAATKAANQPRIVSIRVLPRNVYAAQGAKLTITGINERASQEATLSVQIVAQSGETILSRSLPVSWGAGVSPLLEESLQTSAWAGTCSVRVRVTTRDGVVLTENSSEFDVFPMAKLTVPKAKVAVLDLSRSLIPFLEQRGIEFVEFGPATPRPIPVLVTSVTPKGSAQLARFTQLGQFVEAGGTAVYLDGAGVVRVKGKSNQIRSETMPLSATVEAAQGLWTCIPHLVREHPIFAGLPAGGMMRDVYENVWATQTLRGLGGEAIVASIGYEWFSEDHKLHYSGPGESWWGTDLAVVPHGQGRCLVSQLRLLGNLGKDPVADKILFNLIAWVAGGSP